MNSSSLWAVTQYRQKMQSTDIKTTSQGGSFWEGISTILCCAQIFGIMPLKGMQFKGASMIRFKWLSVQTLICFAFMSWDLVEICIRLHFNKNKKIHAALITTMVFYIMGFFIYGAFLHLAMHWGEIIKSWTNIERRFLQPIYRNEESKGLKRRLAVTGVVIAACSIGEHALFQGSDFYQLYANNNACNITDWSVSTFFNNRLPDIHRIMPHWLPITLSQMVSIYCTAAWNFLDLFIILVSIGITTRFRQLNEALERHLTYEIVSDKEMLSYRMDFLSICDLLDYINNRIGFLVFLSTVNNLYFVCSQLLNVFNPLRYPVEYVYYWYSLFYLIGRTLYLFMMAAAINEAAESPKSSLHNIPSKHWNKESSRFLYQINSRTIALSVMGFCNLTRQLILTMAGAIVTFELVMMQFYHASEALPPLCD